MSPEIRDLTSHSDSSLAAHPAGSLRRSEGMGESGAKVAACRGGRSAQAAPATDPLRRGAAPQPPGHPSQKLHSGGAGECCLHL